ncbi:glutathione degradosome [Pholiota conissans]|uniref:Glutathione degradosome n=1 Tax=Pholiota conissans TaxID=109636 RepID=A0A9P6D027_9AGAR|nr:glutathione degradosome [Pholiota conissans]
MEPTFTIPHPSLSRNLQSSAVSPSLVHSLHETRSSVLSLAANEDYIFSGSQNRHISVWDKNTFQLKTILRGHTGSVLGLEYAPKEKWLFSSSGDSTVRVWSTDTLQLLYVIHPYMGEGAGDLFSITWSSELQTIFIGCQNTSLQWFSFKDPILKTSLSASSLDLSASGSCTPNARKAHKFFDSYPQYERKAADIYANNGVGRIRGRTSPESDFSDASNAEYLDIPATNVLDSAHYGYIYCMTILPEREGMIQLATGSGDETVKLWNCSAKVPTLIHEFECNHGAILALVAQGDTIYAGCQDGYVRVFDLETKTLVRTLIVQEGVDIIAMSLLKSDLYVCSADGSIKRHSASFDCTASWSGHQGIALSSIVTKRSVMDDSGYWLVTGGNDEKIKVWDITTPKQGVRPSDDEDGQHPQKSCIGSGTYPDTMRFALSKFISIPSISADISHKEDCRQGAIWLKKCLGQLGAHTALLANGEHSESNHVVLATFKGYSGDKPKPRILFYGHYDVIPAPMGATDGWESDPFSLTGRNGYLYGRGVTDNKGPIIASACAAADLLSRRALGVDLVFLIEGEEECGSKGFKEIVQKHKDTIGPIDAILVSNSTWIANDRPCITYGLRGVVHCGININNAGPDVHSGIEGGAVIEPMMDMVRLLATLVDNNRVIQIPHFYDKVRPQTEDEKKLYKLLSEITKKPASLLSSRWREPSLTVHNVQISGPKNSTVIPGKVEAQISLRIVPDQDLDTIVQSLRDHLQKSFDDLHSPNTLQISVNHTADWWLGDLDDYWFKALESAVQEEWGVEPLRIREGGSIPSVPYLEKEFGCHALQLPMGQSSDQAHLPNEQISIVNLQKGKAVIERFLLKVANKDSPET